MSTPDSFNGNYVVVRINAGVYADYAHLQEGSVAVQVVTQLARAASAPRLRPAPLEDPIVGALP